MVNALLAVGLVVVWLAYLGRCRQLAQLQGAGVAITTMRDATEKRLRDRIAVLETRLRNQTAQTEAGVTAARAHVAEATAAVRRFKAEADAREKALVCALLKARTAFGAFNYDTSHRVN